MRKKIKTLSVAVLCAILLAGCGTSTSSSSESPSSSTTVQDAASSDSNEALNDSLEEFEVLKNEAENLLEEGNYKEAVVAAAKAYQFVEDKEGEEEIPLRVAEKLAEECGLKNPKAEIDTTKDDKANYIQINCEYLGSLITDDEVLDICKEIKNKGVETIEAGGIEAGIEKPYVISDLISYGRRHSVVSNQNGKDELVMMDEASVQKRAKRDTYLTKGKNSKESSVSNNQAVSQEYKSALSKGLQYANQLHMSKQAIYDQLTSSYGEGFPADAAQYAVDNMTGVDWNANALAKAREYYYKMSMSKSAVYDQLTSDYGEQFTASQARYAVDHLD